MGLLCSHTEFCLIPGTVWTSLRLSGSKSNTNVFRGVWIWIVSRHGLKTGASHRWGCCVAALSLIPGPRGYVHLKPRSFICLKIWNAHVSISGNYPRLYESNIEQVANLLHAQVNSGLLSVGLTISMVAYSLVWLIGTVVSAGSSCSLAQEVGGHIIT